MSFVDPIHLFKFSRLLVSTLKNKKKKRCTDISLARSSGSGTTREGATMSQFSHLAHWDYYLAFIYRDSYSYYVYSPFANFMSFYSEAYTPFLCTSRSKYPINPRSSFPQTKSL